MGIELYWVSLVVFLCLSAFFSGSETALFSLSKVEHLKLAQDPRWLSRLVTRLWNRRERMLNTLLLGNNFANIGASLAGGAITAHYFSHSELMAFLFGFIGVTLLLIVFGEVLPKSVSVSWGLTIARLGAPLLMICYYLLSPLQMLTTAAANAGLRLLGIRPKGSEEFLSDEEMKILVTHGVHQSSVEASEMEMIGGVLDFSEATVDEIMTPRTELEAYEDSLPHDEMLEALRRSRHSRVLLYKETRDDITGVLHVKDVLLNPRTPFREFVRTPLFVPPKKNLYELLKEFRVAHTHIAVVSDEFGGVAGIVTLNDLLEEIFGKIEEKAGEQETLIVAEGERTFKIRGKIEVWDLNKALGLALPEESGRTLSGYLMNEIGHIPQPGERFEDDWGEYEILEVVRRRIEWVRMWRKLREKSEEAADALSVDRDD
ncbi:MAG: hemolysin family protein [Candidatus Sumerlaeia bacterium]